MKIYFDGGCKPNPGNMEICIVIEYRGHRVPLMIKNLGYGTNNIAEWAAINMAAVEASKLNPEYVEFIGDSNLVVNQAKGNWKIKDKTLKELHDSFIETTKGMKIKIRHIRREFNLAGNYLEKGCY